MSLPLSTSSTLRPRYVHVQPTHEQITNVASQGPTLEEIARIFDGPSAVAPVDMDAIARQAAKEHLQHSGDEKELHVEQTRVV